jgi:hypothetical protein
MPYLSCRDVVGHMVALGDAISLALGRKHLNLAGSPRQMENRVWTRRTDVRPKSFLAITLGGQERIVW